jgi:hypothetical protein
MSESSLGFPRLRCQTGGVKSEAARGASLSAVQARAPGAGAMGRFRGAVTLVFGIFHPNTILPRPRIRGPTFDL